MIRDLAELHRSLRQSKMSAAQLQDLQWRKLQKVLTRALDVPFYRERLESAGLGPGDFQGLEDLQKIPVTVRAELVDEDPLRRIASGEDPAVLHTARTNGTTGEVLEVFQSRPERRIRRVGFLRPLLETGFRPRDRLAVLGPVFDRKEHLHEKLGLYRALNISSLLSPDEQFRKIREFNPTILWFYPSVFQALVDHVGRPLGEWIGADRVISSSEMLPQVLRSRITRELGAEIFNFYGSIEFGRIAYECPTHEGLHVYTDRVLVECLQDGRPVPPGESGSAVITSLDALASPLIRYELGDVVRFTGKACSCGSSFPLIGHPEGRCEDMLILPSGRTSSQHTTEWWIFLAVRPRRYRIIQHSKNFLEVLLEAPSVPAEEVEQRLAATQSEYLQERIAFEVRVLDRFPVEAGKFKTFESRLDKTRL